MGEVEGGFRGALRGAGGGYTSAVLDLYSDGWSSDILEFLRSYNEYSLVLRNIYALPVPTTWETHLGLTLIGDAAHLMSPFAGEGTHFLLRFLI